MTAYTNNYQIVPGEWINLDVGPVDIQWLGGYGYVNIVVSTEMPTIDGNSFLLLSTSPHVSIMEMETVWAYVPPNQYNQNAIINVMKKTLSTGGGGGGFDAATATMQQKELNAISALNSFLADSMPMLYDSSYSVKITALIYANLYEKLNADGSVDSSYMYSQRFDINGNESWYLESKDGTSVALGTLKTANDSDVRLVSENIVQSISELRTLIGRTPADTSARTRTYAMWPPHWEIGESGWM